MKPFKFYDYVLSAAKFIYIQIRPGCWDIW